MIGLIVGVDAGNWVGKPLRGGPLPLAGPLELPRQPPLHLAPCLPLLGLPRGRKPILPIAEDKFRILIPQDLAK